MKWKVFSVLKGNCTPFQNMTVKCNLLPKNITNEQIKIRRFLNFRKIVSSNWFPCYVTVIYVVRIDNLKTENNENG